MKHSTAWTQSQALTKFWTKATPLRAKAPAAQFVRAFEMKAG